jgi:hypothetical protein
MDVKNVNKIIPIVKVNTLLGQIRPLKYSFINLIARIEISVDGTLIHIK